MKDSKIDTNLKSKNAPFHLMEYNLLAKKM